MRRRAAAARVARLATIDPDGRPNLVPCVFALEGDTVHLVVDRKPKRTATLQRIVNLQRDPRATLLIDHYDEDWDALWWVRLRGRARIVTEGPDLDRALKLVRAKYAQYEAVALDEVAIVIDAQDWHGWSAT